MADALWTCLICTGIRKRRVEASALQGTIRLQQSLPPDSKLLAHCGTLPTTRPVGFNQVSADRSSSSRGSTQRSPLIILLPSLHSPNIIMVQAGIFLAV